MKTRTEAFHLRRGHQMLTIGPVIENGLTRYAGYIDGSRRVTSITPEGAVAALLRHVVGAAVHAGQAA